jgi:hypothetical protein
LTAAVVSPHVPSLGRDGSDRPENPARSRPMRAAGARPQHFTAPLGSAAHVLVCRRDRGRTSGGPQWSERTRNRPDLDACTRPESVPRRKALLLRTTRYDTLAKCIRKGCGPDGARAMPAERPFAGVPPLDGPVRRRVGAEQTVNDRLKRRACPR